MNSRVISVKARAVIVSILLTLSQVACSSYHELLTAEPPGPRLGKRDLATAEEIARSVAAKHKMRRWPGSTYIADSSDKPFREVTRFIGPGIQTNVVLILDVSKDLSEFRFYVGDSMHGSETEFIAGLRGDLEKEIEKHLGHYSVRKEEQTSRSFLPLAP